jgi:hypothetical protein
MSKLGDARFSGRAFRTIVGTVLGTVIPMAVLMCGGSTNGSVCDGPPDAAGLSCNATYTVKGCSSVTLGDTGTLDCYKICGAAADCKVNGNDVDCTLFCAVDGRRPPGLSEQSSPSHTLAEHFAGIAFFERASAEAFDVLASELRAHGAPDRLIASARRAKRDELDHARRARALAGRSHVRRTRSPARTTRSLFAIALDNAKEGCARETFGALLGWAQAERAEDESARSFYARIARDETRHASLSWRLHAWLMTKLSDAEKKKVEAELETSLRGIAAAHSPLDSALGVPDASTCHALASELRRLAAS